MRKDLTEKLAVIDAGLDRIFPGRGLDWEGSMRPDFLSSYRRWAFPFPTTYKISVALRPQIMKLLNRYQKNIQEHWYVYGMYLRIEYIRKEIHRAAEENGGAP
ncbi:MAG: hypothetical protein Q4C66_06340 [Lachnospiraceae bacterium]|nr:hypothetical protein [Lachnospiraceae bacterium]